MPCGTAISIPLRNNAHANRMSLLMVLSPRDTALFTAPPAGGAVSLRLCSTRALRKCRMVPSNPLVSDPPWGIEADAIQANLGRLPSRHDLVAAGSLHRGVVARAQGANAVRQRRAERL